MRWKKNLSHYITLAYFCSSFNINKCDYVCTTGGPGSGKGTQCGRIIERYPDFVHLSMGDIIRTEISTHGTADDKWGMISQLVSKGEMAPEVGCNVFICLSSTICIKYAVT